MTTSRRTRDQCRQRYLRKTGSTTLPAMADRAPTPRNQFSFSRLKTFHQCPLRYRYRYLAGRREAFRSLETFLGSTMHSVLEWLYDRREHGESPSLESALEELARRWREDWTQDIAVVRIGGSAEDAFRDAREMLSLFHRSTFARDGSETVALEQRFSVPLSDDMYFSGVADRIGRTANRRLFVVDYKTSRSPGTPEEFSEGLQAQLYAGCALRRHDDSEALAGYHYLRLGKHQLAPGVAAPGGAAPRPLRRARPRRLATPPSFRPDPGSCARGAGSTPSVRRRGCRSSCPEVSTSPAPRGPSSCSRLTPAWRRRTRPLSARRRGDDRGHRAYSPASQWSRVRLAESGRGRRGSPRRRSRRPARSRTTRSARPPARWHRRSGRPRPRAGTA